MNPTPKQITRALEGADTPLSWLLMEADGDATSVEATVWPGGETRVLARAGYHGRPVRWLA